MSQKMITMYDFHKDNGAAFMSYNGWELPSEYAGFDKEYRAIRNGLGIIDSSALTKIKICGEDAEEYIDTIITGNAASLVEESSLYTGIAKNDGTILALIWLLCAEEEFFICSDVFSRENLMDHLKANLDASLDVEIKDETNTLGSITVLGPNAFELVQAMFGDDIIALPYLGFEYFEKDEVNIMVARIGLTGEYEYRFFLPVDLMQKIWSEIINVAKESNIEIVPCGCEVLHTLLLEMKNYVSHLDFNGDVTFLQAGMHWVIDFRKDDFVGKDVIFQERDSGLYDKNLLLTIDTQKKFPTGAAVTFESKGRVGSIIRSDYSPTMQKVIGIAKIKNECAWVGLDFEVEADGRKVAARAVSVPLFETLTTKKARE